MAPRLVIRSLQPAISLFLSEYHSHPSGPVLFSLYRLILLQLLYLHITGFKNLAFFNAVI